MKKIKYSAAAILVIIGSVHIGFSLIEFESISADALWFVGGGLSIIFAGLFNLFALQIQQEQKRCYILKAVNVMLTIFLILMVTKLPMIPGFVALGCSIVLTVSNSCQ